MGKDKNERRTPWCGYTITHLMPSIALRNTAVISGFGPVSGLMSGISQSAPSHVTTQWRDADCWLIYRCGGSAGFVADR